MELSPLEMYEIVEEYQLRKGDFLETWGIYQCKGRNGKFHDCHVKIKSVYKPIQKDTKQIIFESNMKIKELEEKLKMQEISDNFNNALLSKLLKEKNQ